MTAKMQVQPIRPAATVILVRDPLTDHGSFEIFMLRRTSKAAFAGGMYVFPGGRVDGDDHLQAYDACRDGPLEQQAPQQHAMGYEWRGFWIAVIREAFEETGLLLAYDAGGELLSFADPVVHSRFDALREPLHSGALSLLQICQMENLTLACDRIHYYNRFVTPLGRPRRFDTRFFIAETPPAQVGLHDDVETVDSIWISPEEALTRNDAKEFDLMNVTCVQLERLAGYSSKSHLLAMAERNREFPVYRPVLPTDR